MKRSLDLPVKIRSLEIKNFKNVNKGKIIFVKNEEKEPHENIIGLYGQNGSGKTTFVNALDLLKTYITNDLVMLVHRKSEFNDYFSVDSNKAEIIAEFDILLKNLICKISYKISFMQDSFSKNYYVLKEDGDVYRYVLGRNNSNGVYLVSSSKMYTHDNYGSEILDFNYAGEKSEATFIRTEDSIYRNTALNRDMCLKYVDIDCEYEFLKDEILTEHYEHIMAYNGSMLITNYLKVFNLNTGN